MYKDCNYAVKQLLYVELKKGQEHSQTMFLFILHSYVFYEAAHAFDALRNETIAS